MFHLPPMPTCVARAVLLLVALAFWSSGRAEAGCTHLPAGFKPVETLHDTPLGTDAGPLHERECSEREEHMDATVPVPKTNRPAQSALVAVADPFFAARGSFPRSLTSGEPISRPSGIFHPPRHG